jgi:hypothetical protein
VCDKHTACFFFFPPVAKKTRFLAKKMDNQGFLLAIMEKELEDGDLF